MNDFFQYAWIDRQNNYRKHLHERMEQREVFYHSHVHTHSFSQPFTCSSPGEIQMQRLICMELQFPLLHHPVAGEAGSLRWPAVIDRPGAAAVWVASRVQLSGALTRLLARHWCSGGAHVVRVKGPSLRFCHEVIWTTSYRETWRSYFVIFLWDYLDIIYG